MNNLDFLGENAYIPKSLNPATPRGIRNCNPLNIHYNAHNDWVGKYPKEYNNDGGGEPPQANIFYDRCRSIIGGVMDGFCSLRCKSTKKK